MKTTDVTKYSEVMELLEGAIPSDSILYSYYIHYNPYNKTWNIINRLYIRDYHNGNLIPDGKIFSNRDISELVNEFKKSLNE